MAMYFLISPKSLLKENVAAPEFEIFDVLKISVISQTWLIFEALLITYSPIPGVEFAALY